MRMNGSRKTSQGAKGVVRADDNGPSIAWFATPSDNIVSVLEGTKS